MQCAHCQKDFNEDENKKGFYTKQNPHFMQPYRIYGKSCPHCGHHNTIFQVSIDVTYQYDARHYTRLDNIVEDFKRQLEKFYKRNESKEPTLFNVYED